MRNIGKMISLARKEKKVETAPPAAVPGSSLSDGGPDYPYGMCLCLDDETLKKLDLDDDCEYGDTIHLFALAKVTSKSKNVHGTRIELQITDVALESEDEENEEKASKRYGADEDED